MHQMGRSMTATSGTVTARDTSGLLQLQANEQECALVFADRPVALVWSDPTVDASQWYLRSVSLADVDRELTALAICQQGPSADLPLGVQLQPLLKLLAEGTYDVSEVEELDLGQGDAYPPPSPADWAGVHRADTDTPLLLGSVPRTLLEQREIRRLMSSIRAGRQPVSIILTGTACMTSFIIAGHACLEAYLRLQRPPCVITLKAQRLVPLSFSKACVWRRSGGRTPALAG